jgi:hypothetical protein
MVLDEFWRKTVVCKIFMRKIVIRDKLRTGTTVHYAF